MSRSIWCHCGANVPERLTLILSVGDVVGVRRSCMSCLIMGECLCLRFDIDEKPDGYDAGMGGGRGVMEPPIDRLTSDGYDLQFGTNVLGKYFPS